MTTPRDPDAPIPELEGDHYVLWVEGRRAVRAWDEEAKAHADRLTHAATALGLHAFRQKLTDDNDPELGPRRRAWTHRRVSSDDVLSFITKLPGVTFDDLVEHLYREEPWSEVMQAAARGKARVALHRLKDRGLVVKVYSENGMERWQVPGTALGPRTPSTGPSASLRNETGLTPHAGPTADGLLAGAAVLEKLNIYPPHVLATDPHLYVDLARAVWGAVSEDKLP
jgi:hypothetical protein